jgi:hypothetical protein
MADTIEGTVDRRLWYHYDLTNDVLYLRLLDHRNTETVSEESPDGVLLLRRLDTDEVVGMTVVNWWKRFGGGGTCDSLRELERRIEPWGQRLAA